MDPTVQVIEYQSVDLSRSLGQDSHLLERECFTDCILLPGIFTPCHGP